MQAVRFVRWALCLCPFFVSAAGAAWTQFNLPSLSQAFGGTALAHLADGRYLFGESGNLFLQDAWNAPAYTPFLNEPAGIDPSFIAVRPSGAAALGAGGGTGFSAIYTFDGTDVSASFTSNGAAYNFDGVFHDDNSLLIGGASFGVTNHHIQYLKSDGSQFFTLIEDVSTFSAGLAQDDAGNLYVADGGAFTGGGEIYRFSQAQLDAAIAAQTSLTTADGQLIHDFGEGGDVGSIAVDGQGRLWAAGWRHNGLLVYDPSTGAESQLIPNLNNANYKVAAFSHGGESYVAWMNQADPSQGGTDQIYGFDLASNVVIPEPASALLMGAALLILAVRRKRLL